VVLLTVALAFGCGRQPAEPVDHVLLITVDTLRADRIDAFGGSFGLTPHLDALAQQSVRFETAYAAAPFTLPSVAALMTGTAPEALGVYRNESTVPDAVPTLASRLRSAGWQTHAVVSNFVLRSSSGIDLGFERFDDSFPQREVVRLWPERIAVDTTDAALEQLDPDFRAPVVLRDVLDLNYRDIAEILDLPLGTVKSRIARGRGALADHLRLEELPDLPHLADEDSPADGNQPTTDERPNDLS